MAREPGDKKKKPVAKAPITNDLADASQTSALNSPRSRLKEGATQVLLNAVIQYDYGTVEVRDWDYKPPSDPVYVANLCALADDVRNLPSYHTNGVPRSRSSVTQVDHIPDAPSSDGQATLDLYLVHLVSIV